MPGSRVYSRSLALGQGFAYNEGVQEAGATCPFWMIITAPAHWAEPLGTNVVVFLVKLIGVLLGLAAVSATAILARRLSGSDWIGCLAALLFALEPRLLFSALSGMEVILLVALWTWICVALLQEHFVLSLILFSLTPVTRPEAILILPFSVLAMIGLIRRQGVTAGTVAICAIPAVPMLLWMLFCQTVTGHWLPNTYYMKAEDFHLGLSEAQLAWGAVSQHGFASLWVYVPGLAGCAILFRSERRLQFGVALLMLLVAPIIFLLGVVGTRYIVLEGYYWTRWLDPAAIMLTIPFCLGYSSIIGLVLQPKLFPWWAMPSGRHWAENYRKPAAAERVSRGLKKQSKSRRLRARSLRTKKVLPAGRLLSDQHFFAIRAAGIVMLLMLVLSIPKFSESFVNRRWQLSSDSRATTIMNVGMGEWIRDHTPKDAVVAVNDAGAIRYFGQRFTIDIMGLNNAAIAFGKMSLQDVLVKADWITIFPGWFSGTPFMEEVLRKFEPRHEIRIPLEEYTVCPSPLQTLKVAFQKKVPPLTPRDADKSRR